MNDEASSPLRQWWWALPAAFPWMETLSEGEPAASAATIGANVFPFGRLLTQLLDAWEPVLSSGGLTADGLWTMASQVEAGFARLRESLATATPLSFGWPTFPAATPWTAWSAPLLLATGNSATSARNPLQLGADRTFGAFADALGLRPMREIQEAWIALSEAERERRAAQAIYVGLAAKAWSDGTRRLVACLEQMRRGGEQVTTFAALLRLWAREADVALHAVMQSEPGLAAAARTVRASNRQREAMHRLVGLTSQALNVPTRAEVDDAYREIQELKRELRRLKKGRPQGVAEVEASPGSTGTGKSVRRARSARVGQGSRR